jgi:hypothetical protein
MHPTEADGRGEGTGEDLERGLKDRHIQLIAIGGAIGVGLFLGSAAIQTAGLGRRGAARPTHRHCPAAGPTRRAPG